MYTYLIPLSSPFITFETDRMSTKMFIINYFYVKLNLQDLMLIRTIIKIIIHYTKPFIKMVRILQTAC